MILCLAIQILNIPVGVVISFDGAVCGFLLIYIIPIWLHLKCYYN
jgi:sodium-coupled neutral amino acid transporter 9